jgi:NAD(P)-dependent dehydrogenase (short-subunit alcohol dehydrogenase family)
MNDRNNVSFVLSPVNFQPLIDDNDAVALAEILRHDQKICFVGGHPSLLAVHLTGISQDLADGIASHLLLGDVATKIPLSILQLQYVEVLGGIKAHAQRIYQPKMVDPANLRSKPALTISELKITLRVLRFLTNVKGLNPARPLQYAIDDIESHIKEPQEPPADEAQDSVPSRFSYYPTCYICHARLSETNGAYPGYPSLCWPCGSFNLSCSELSLPVNLSLNGRTALVTGGRLNLGYHTALQLLRCGAHVIVTSRYPRDAERRYQDETGFGAWQERLKIVGADFRTARDVFRLVSTVRRALADWSLDGVPRLEILINIAAQTLTDSEEAKRKAITQETELRESRGPSSLLIDHDECYTPRVRGGSEPLGLEMSNPPTEQMHTPNAAQNETNTTAVGSTMSRPSSRPQSSWTQTLHDIPYEDVISAHSVNTFVPLILIRELLPLMGATLSAETPPASNPLHPAGYITNVTSREGTFDSSIPSPSTSSPRLRKTRHHVHTNMSKAALNMITETEAAACWHDRRVCMNSVDPGYMSAAPGFGRNGRTPLGWDDGAGRVLWPLAVGWGRKAARAGNGPGAAGRVIWGQFLKHYTPSRWGGEGV